MKILICFLASLLIQGLSGDETDAIQTVSVLEGDSVTLESDLTQTEDLKVWSFGPDNTVIAVNSEIKIFRDRFLVNQSTGSLTIKNITANFSGIYKLTFIRTGSYKTFNVTVYARLPVPVISGNSLRCSSCLLSCSVVNVSHVTLSWFKGNSLLSSISVSDLSISLSLPLEVEYQNNNTYSCVLNNPITNHTTHLDIYTLCQPCEAQGLSAGVLVAICFGVLFLLAVVGLTFGIYKKYFKKTEENGQSKELRDFEQHNTLNNDELITDQEKDLLDGQAECKPLIQGTSCVELDQVKKIKVERGKTITLNTGVNEIKRDGRLRWKYIDSRVSESTTTLTVIAVCDKGTDRFEVKDGPGGKFKDRLQLDPQTGNLTIKNMRVKDTGHFILKFTSNSLHLTKSIKVNVRAPTKKEWNDLDDRSFSFVPDEDPCNSTTYTVELTDTDEE